MTPKVETTDPEGVDFGWVMQVTFVVTVVVGAPVVAVLSLGARLPDWGARAAFAVRVGALVWFATALCVYGYARWVDERDADEGTDGPSRESDAQSGPDSDR